MKLGKNNENTITIIMPSTNILNTFKKVFFTFFNTHNPHKSTQKTKPIPEVERIIPIDMKIAVFKLVFLFMLSPNKTYVKYTITYSKNEAGSVKNDLGLNKTDSAVS
jgi:hypothetical protein